MGQRLRKRRVWRIDAEIERCDRYDTEYADIENNPHYPAEVRQSATRGRERTAARRAQLITERDTALADLRPAH